MEGAATDTPALAYVAQSASAPAFMLVDIGCGGGIDEIWRRFGRRLRALGIDPRLAEIHRLRSVETHPGIEYVAACATLPDGHPFAKAKAGRGDCGRNPWNRLSVARSQEIVKARARPLSTSEMTAVNLWPEMTLADQAIVVPEYLRDRGIESVDFLKIDIDGKDFDVLTSFQAALDPLQILGLGLEVNFYGTAADTDHTLHNTDRFMKARGFDLFGLTVRHYSAAALPSRYVQPFAHAAFGRPLQGDALYVRDLGNPEFDDFSAGLHPAKLLNLVCIFAAFDLPDCAAEVAVRFGKRLAPFCDVEHLLDLLAAQAQGDVDKPLTYQEYTARFEAHDAMFFPGASGVATGRLSAHIPQIDDVRTHVARRLPRPLLTGFRRLRRAWRVLREPLC